MIEKERHVVQERRAKSHHASAKFAQLKANTGNKAADRLKPQKRKANQKAKQTQARHCLDGAPRLLGEVVRSQSKQLA